MSMNNSSDFSNFKLVRKASGWITTRFIHISAIWIAVGLLLAFILKRWPKATFEVGESNLLSTETLKGMADLRLLVYLFVAWGIVQLIARLVLALSNKDESDNQKVDAFTDALFDEISSTATHGGCVTVLALVIERWLSTPNPQAIILSWELSLSLVILFFAGAIATFDVSAIKPNVDKFKKKFTITFASLKDGDTVNAQEDVRGELSSLLPEGYELWATRHWPAMKSEFYPVMRVTITSAIKQGIWAKLFKLRSYKWSASGFNFGGNSGDLRTIDLWLVGPNGIVIFEESLIQAKKFNDLRNAAALPFDKWPTPALRSPPNDALLCASLSVTRT